MQTFLLQIMQTFDYRFNYDFRWDDTWEYSKMTSRTSSGALIDISDRFALVEAELGQSNSRSRQDLTAYASS